MKQERKLFNQTEMAHKLGISKGTLSKWIIKNNVFPEKVEGNKKLYKETLIDEYRKSKDAVNTNHNKIKRESFSTIEFLKKQVEEKQETIENLQKKTFYLKYILFLPPLALPINTFLPLSIK